MATKDKCAHTEEEDMNMGANVEQSCSFLKKNDLSRLND